MAVSRNCRQNSAPEYRFILGEDDRADVTTLRMNRRSVRAFLTSPAVMMKAVLEPRTPFTSTFSVVRSLEHWRSNPHLSRSTDLTTQPSPLYHATTARIAAASTKLFS